MFKVSLLLISTLFILNAIAKDVHKFHVELVQPPKGIGAREAGTSKELKTAQYLEQELTNIGYQPIIQDFTFGKKKLSSQNIIVNTKEDQTNSIVLVAHYDSTAAERGSLGATDNGAGVATILALASQLESFKKLSYNIRFIAFGAEENGLLGSRHYISELKKQPHELKKIKAMINFDTIAGGDFIYVHSAHTTPYKCATKEFSYNNQTNVRDSLLKASITVLGEDNKYVIHPAYPGYPEGVTGSWSDHAPFACAGIPIAYIESTNFTINGKNGYDGYSQSTNPALWDCYDPKSNSACNRDSETKWGHIWHTEFDRLEQLNKMFPKRIEQQLNNNVAVLTEFLLNADKYLTLK